jgi:nucleoside-diphosphate-sugar epimerase
MRILVSGAGGFIGRHVAALAASQGLSVHTIGTGVVGTDHAAAHGTHHRIGAVDDTMAIRAAMETAAPDAILHLAGSTQWRLPAELYRVNAAYAQVLLDTAAQVCPGTRVLLAGTAAEYGPMPEVELVSESAVAQPTTLYGISKLAQTLQGMAVGADRLRVVTARIFNCVGPGMPTTLAIGSFVRQVAAMPPEGGKLNVGNLDSIRDFVRVDEVAAALLQISASDASGGEIFNVASGTGQNLNDVVAALCKAAPFPVQVHQDDRIQGNSAMRRFVGDPTKLGTLGISVKPACFRELLPIMLKAARP